MYSCTCRWFRGVKHAKLVKKGVFLSMFTIIGYYVTDKSRKNMKKHVFRVCLPTWNICAYGVFWKSFYKDDIHPEIRVPPPPGLVPCLGHFCMKFLHLRDFWRQKTHLRFWNLAKKRNLTQFCNNTSKYSLPRIFLRVFYWKFQLASHLGPIAWTASRLPF